MGEGSGRGQRHEQGCGWLAQHDRGKEAGQQMVPGRLTPTGVLTAGDFFLVMY